MLKTDTNLVRFDILDLGPKDITPVLFADADLDTLEELATGNARFGCQQMDFVCPLFVPKI